MLGDAYTTATAVGLVAAGVVVLSAVVLTVRYIVRSSRSIAINATRLRTELEAQREGRRRR